MAGAEDPAAEPGGRPAADAGAGGAGLRRAALPHQLLLPRRGQPPRGAGGGGGAARARRAGRHRPRRPLRRGALRAARPGGRAAHRLRRRADARDHQACNQIGQRRRPRPRGRAPPRAGRGPGRVRAAGPGDQRGADGGGEGAPRLTVGGPGRGGPRAGAPPPAAERPQRQLVRAHRVPQGHGPRGARRRTARPPPSGRSTASSPASAATVCWSSCGTTATRSTGPATTPWPIAGRARRRRRRRHQQRALRHAGQRPLATALAAVRARRSLDEIDGWLPGRRRSRTCAARREQERRFARWPGAVARTVELARRCAFDLRLVAARSSPTSPSPPVTTR